MEARWGYSFAADSVIVVVETKHVLADNDNPAGVKRTVPSATRAVVVTGIRVQASSLIGWMAVRLYRRSRGCRRSRRIAVHDEHDDPGDSQSYDRAAED